MLDPFDEIVDDIEGWLASEHRFARRLASRRQRRRMIAAIMVSCPKLDDPEKKPILGFWKEKIHKGSVQRIGISPLIILALQILLPILIDLILRWLTNRGDQWPDGALSGARSELRRD